MLGVKPDTKLWSRVNEVIMGESVAKVVITFISAMCQMLIRSGGCSTEEQARVQLAAMLLSPDTAQKPGSLLPMLGDELKRLDDGKWIT